MLQLCPLTCPSFAHMRPPSDIPMGRSVLLWWLLWQVLIKRNGWAQSCHVIFAEYFVLRLKSAANSHSPPSNKRDHFVVVQRCLLVPDLVNWIHFGAVGELFVNFLLIGSWPPGSLLAYTGPYHVTAWTCNATGCGSYWHKDDIVCHSRKMK